MCQISSIKTIPSPPPHLAPSTWQWQWRLPPRPPPPRCAQAAALLTRANPPPAASPTPTNSQPYPPQPSFGRCTHLVLCSPVLDAAVSWAGGCVPDPTSAANPGRQDPGREQWRRRWRHRCAPGSSPPASLRPAVLARRRSSEGTAVPALASGVCSARATAPALGAVAGLALVSPFPVSSRQRKGYFLCCLHERKTVKIHCDGWVLRHR